MTAQEKFTAPRGVWHRICYYTSMKYLLTISATVGVIAYHGAWGSVECPLLLSIAVLACVIIKSESDEQREKKSAE